MIRKRYLIITEVVRCMRPAFLVAATLSHLLHSDAPAQTMNPPERTTPEHSGVALIENRGQWSNEARFLHRGAGIQSWITGDGVVYDVTTGDGRGHVVRMRFQGAPGAVTVTGADEQHGRYNYFRGSDPNRWVTDVRRFASARITGLYEGIDAVYYVDDGALRYDLVVSPGADPERVRLRFEGARSIAVGSDGDLAIATSVGVIEQRGLFAYQERGGRRQQVACRFVSNANGTVGFALGAYDRSRPLVIDPLVYSAVLGGDNWQFTTDGVLGTDGSTYTTGRSSSTDLPTTVGAYQRKNAGDADLFVIRMSDDGARLVYATYIGGQSSDVGRAIAVDGDGNTYVTGFTWHGSYPTTEGAFDRDFFETPHSSDGDAIVTKLSPMGDRLLYSTLLGMHMNDEGTGIAVDSDGNAYVTGFTETSYFHTTPNAFNRTYNGKRDAFVAKLDATGSALVYSTLLGGKYLDQGMAIDIDDAGCAFVVGITGSDDFPTTEDAFNTHKLAGSAQYDAFVTKLDPTGSRLEYSGFIGGHQMDSALGVSVGKDGSAYVAGVTHSSSLLRPDGSHSRTHGAGDGFVVGVSPDGARMLFARMIGGTRYDVARRVRCHVNGNLYVVGETISPDFPTTPGAHDTTAHEFTTFLTVLGPDGGSQRYSTFLGGRLGPQWARGLDVAAHGDAVVFGETWAKDFPVTPGAFRSASDWSWLFISRIRPRIQLGANASIEVTSPRDGDIVCAGVPYMFTWRATEVPAIDIALSSDGGTTWDYEVAVAFEAAVGAFTWVPPTNLAGGSYRVRVAASGTPTVAGTSTGPFTLRTWKLVTDPVRERSFCPGLPMAFVFESSVVPIAVQWEVGEQNGEFAPIPGATGTRFEIPSVPTGFHNRRYRAKAWLDCGEITTNALQFQANDSIAPVPDRPALDVVSGVGSVTVGSVPTATDNCSGSVQGVTTSPLSYSVPGTYEILWTYEDYRANRSTQTQTVIVEPGTVSVERSSLRGSMATRAVPNPFTSETRIEFFVPSTCRVNVIIYDIAGRVVEVLADEMMSRGERSVVWSVDRERGLSHTPGTYTYRVTAGNDVATGVVVLTR